MKKGKEVRLTQLTQTEKEVIRVLLSSQQATLNSLVASLARNFKFLSESKADDVNDISYVEELVSTHVLTQLKNVEKASKNVESENFGVCEICHKSIPFKRLMAIPTAVHCVQCATNNDHHQHRISRTTFRSLIISF